MKEIENDYEDIYEDLDMSKDIFSFTEELTKHNSVEKLSANKENEKEENKEPPLKYIINLMEEDKEFSTKVLYKIDKIFEKLDELSLTINDLSNKIEIIYEICNEKETSTENEEKKSWFVRLKRGKREKTKKKELLKLLIAEDFSEQQLLEIQEAIEHGLEITEIRTFAQKDFSPTTMKRMREMYKKMKG